jgi:hypothetical protein
MTSTKVQVQQRDYSPKIRRPKCFAPAVIQSLVLLLTDARRMGSGADWQSLMGVNHTFQQFSKRFMNNGDKTLFSEDNFFFSEKWVNTSPLSE